MAFLLLCVGIIEGFFGYRIYKFMLGVCGFFIGGFIGGSLGALSEMKEVSIFMIIVGAVIGASIAVKVWKIGIFIQCFFYGYAIFSALGTAFEYSRSIGIWDIMNIVNFNSPSTAGIIGGIIFGILGVTFTRIIIIITSSLTGGLFCSFALTGMGIIGSGGIGWATIIIAVIGMEIQFKYTGMDKKTETPSESYNNYRTTIGPEPAADDKRGSGHCPNCGNLIKSDEQFCYKCGARKE